MWYNRVSHLATDPVVIRSVPATNIYVMHYCPKTCKLFVVLTYLCNEKSATHPKSFKREEQCHQLYCSTETETLLFRKIFKMRFFVYSISHHLIASKILGVKLLLGTFCDETLYITNECRFISRIIKVALLNNFRAGS